MLPTSQISTSTVHVTVTLEQSDEKLFTWFSVKKIKHLLSISTWLKVMVRRNRLMRQFSEKMENVWIGQAFDKAA